MCLYGTFCVICLVTLSNIFFVFVCVALVILFFFFQAEDGIRDRDVTGVQTCALPISCAVANVALVVGQGAHTADLPRENILNKK